MNEQNKSWLISSNNYDYSEDVYQQILNNRKLKRDLRIKKKFEGFNCVDVETIKSSNCLKDDFSKCSKGNTIINKFKDFTEYVFYKHTFNVPYGVSVETDVDRTRKWVKSELGVLSPIRDDAKVSDLQRSLMNSRKRALDTAYGYILCNDWQYWVTVTFKHGKTKRLSDDVVKYQWKKFRQQLQYRFPDIKIFLIPENTPTGVKGLHFHGFIGNADLSEYLRPAVNNKKIYDGGQNEQYKEFLYTEFGDPIFNFVSSFVNVGFTDVVKIRENTNKLKLMNYMTKYMSKDSGNFQYNEKSYFHTHNLEFKDKEVAWFFDKEKKELVNNLFAECYKETKDFTIYRIYNDKS